MPRRYFQNRFGPGPFVLEPGAIKEKASNLASLILQKFPGKSANCDGGIYVGVAGAAYAFWYAASKPQFNSDKGKLLQAAKKLISVHLTEGGKNAKRDIKENAAFVLGNGGVFATGALLQAALGDKTESEKLVKKFAEAAAIALPVGFLPCGGDELLVGRAGFLIGVLNLRKKLGVSVISDEAILQMMRVVLESGRRYSRTHRSPCPLMYSYYETEYLGAAHGLAGIMQALLSFPEILRQADEKAESDVRETVEFILKIQQPNGNFPCAMDELGGRRNPEDELVHWCHGAPGTIYLMAKAYLLWKDDKYLKACISSGDIIWDKGLLKKGPGVCHGVAGNAYAFLLLYQLTHDESYLHKAHKFAEFMDSAEFKSGARTPDTPYSLYEGIAGTLCFYVDLLDPKNAEFPLYPVF